MSERLESAAVPPVGSARELDHRIRRQAAEVRGLIAELDALGAREEARALRKELLGTMIDGLR